MSKHFIHLWRERIEQLKKYKGKNARSAHFQRIEGRIESYLVCIRELGTKLKKPGDKE